MICLIIWILLVDDCSVWMPRNYLCADSVIMCGHMKMPKSGQYICSSWYKGKANQKDDINNIHMYIILLFPKYSVTVQIIFSTQYCGLYFLPMHRKNDHVFLNVYQFFHRLCDTTVFRSLKRLWALHFLWNFCAKPLKPVVTHLYPHGLLVVTSTRSTHHVYFWLIGIHHTGVLCEKFLPLPAYHFTHNLQLTDRVAVM